MRAVPVLVLGGLLLLAALLFSIATRGRVRSADPRRYRPRWRHAGPGAGSGATFEDPSDEAPFDEARPGASASTEAGAAATGATGADADAGALTDFFTGAALDPARPIVRCEDCRALYHPDTAAMLTEHNAGRCASCGGADLRPLVRRHRARAGRGPVRALVPEPASPEAYARACGRLAAITGTVVRGLPARPGGWPAVLLHDARGLPLRVVFVGGAGRGLRGRALAYGLIGARVRVRGLLQADEAMGFRLLLSDPAMVAETGR